jgi:hypothetical protein
VDGTATITVTADLTATVTVTNALDGTPIEGATVEVEGGASAVTDASGIATVAVPDAGPQDITALVDDSYSAVTWLGVTTRSLAIPLTPKSTTTDGLIDGTMDFTGVDDAAWNQIVIGLVPAAFSQALPTVSLQSLFGADRTVTVFGTDVTLPANLVIEGTEETYEVGAPPGDVGVWGFAGPILTSDVTHATGGPGDAINLLLDNLGAMSWGWLGGGTLATGGTTTLDLAPADSFADTLSVSLPGLPLGFHGDETWFVMTADECREGWVVTGLGQGTSASTVERVPDGTSGCRGDQSVLATAEVGGLGSGGATTTTTATDDGTGTWTFDDPQDTPSVDAWDPSTRALTVSVDSDSTFVRIRMEDNRYNVHDYFTAGSYSGTVPGDFSAFHRPQAAIEVWSLDASGASYDERATTGSADPREFQVRTSAVVTREP